MAVSLNTCLISKEEGERVRTDLIFTREKGSPIYFYLPLRELWPDVDPSLVRLPYHYYCQRFGSPSNWSTQFTTGEWRFTGQLRDHQRQPLKEATQCLARDGTVMLNLFTGAGKTVSAIYLAARPRLLTLVIYTRVGLGDQWFKAFRTYSTAGIWRVGVGYDEQVDVILSTDEGVSKIPRQFLDRIGMLIIDEAHMFCTSSRVNALLCCEPRYLVLCTATIVRQDGMHNMIYSLVGENIITRISRKPFRVDYYRTGITVPVVIHPSTGKVDWSAHNHFLAESQQRNQQIVDLVRCFPHDKFLILTWLDKDHAQPLAELIASYSISVSCYSGKTRKYRESRVTVGTISKMGTGFDEANACGDDYSGQPINKLIVAGSTKDPSLVEQIYGRCLRADYPHIFCLVDNSAISSRHAEVAIEWCRSRNGEIVETDWRKIRPVKRLLYWAVRAVRIHYGNDQLEMTMGQLWANDLSADQIQLATAYG